MAPSLLAVHELFTAMPDPHQFTLALLVVIHVFRGMSTIVTGVPPDPTTFLTAVIRKG